jgi:hypothetical protein
VLVVLGFLGLAFHKNSARPPEYDPEQEVAPPEERAS